MNENEFIHFYCEVNSEKQQMKEEITRLKSDNEKLKDFANAMFNYRNYDLKIARTLHDCELITLTDGCRYEKTEILK